MLRRLYIVLPFVCTLIACQPVRNAQQTVAMADSLRVNEGVTCDDSLALAEAYSTLGHWRLIYPDDYARACYYYGRMLRNRNDQVAAMRAFISGTHAPYVQRVVPLPWFTDYHILGRIYTNMGVIAHLAGEFKLSCQMYEHSSNMFLRDRDTISYYYVINAMAFEYTMSGDEESASGLLRTIENNCSDNGVKTKLLETKSELCLRTQQYDSAIYYANRLYANGNNSATGLLIKAQAFSYMSRKDSAAYYAQLVLDKSNALGDKNNALYILANDDNSKDTEAVRQVSADRSDIQKLIEIRQGKLSQAVQLLEQDHQCKPNWRGFVAIAFIVFCITTSIVVVRIGKRHKSQMQRQVSTIATTQANAIIESIKQHIDTADLNSTLHWKDYASMKVDADLYMGGIVSKLEARHLNETEIRFCVLTLLDVRLNQIAKIIHYSYPSGIKTLKKRTAVKLGSSAPNLKDFLLHLLPEA